MDLAWNMFVEAFLQKRGMSLDYGMARFHRDMNTTETYFLAHKFFISDTPQEAARLLAGILKDTEPADSGKS